MFSQALLEHRIAKLLRHAIHHPVTIRFAQARRTINLEFGHGRMQIAEVYLGR